MITTPVPAQSPSRVPLIIAAVAGLVVGALVVGVLWLTTGGSGGDFGAAATPIGAPDKLGDYQRFETVPPNTTGYGKSTAERTTDWNKRTAQQISDSYDGAAATVQSYASADLQTIFAVQFVRASTPGLYVPYEDPKALGLSSPEQEVKTFGDVQCIVHTQPTSSNAGNPAPVIAADCQRTSGGLTVRIPSVGGDLGEHPDQIAGLVDQAFNAVD